MSARRLASFCEERVKSQCADRRFQAVLHKPRRRDEATPPFANLQPLLWPQRVPQAFIKARTAPASQLRGLSERQGLIVPEARRADADVRRAPSRVPLSAAGDLLSRSRPCRRRSS